MTGSTVPADTTAPLLSFRLPATRATYVGSWARLRGLATDAGGAGVREVVLRAIQQRHGVWFAYRPATHRWTKAGSRSAAWAKSRPASSHTTATNAWTVRLYRLAEGRLIYRAYAVDNADNQSALRSHRQRITRR